MTDLLASTTSVRDILLGELVDFAPKDSTDLMERPFFSLKKSKRIAPIDYASSDGTVTIKVTANAAYGMATIYDADILIWCISKIVAKRNLGDNSPNPIVYTSPSELLTGIGRQVGGSQYRELMAAIQRLRTTQVETNIRGKKNKWAAFHYLGDADGESGPSDSGLNSLALRVPDWLLDGIENSAIVTIDPEYFQISGGIERAIYRAARKHTGSKREGWTCRISVLHHKTGSEAKLKGFTFTLRDICLRNDLPRYSMQMTQTKTGEPAVHFVDRAYLTLDQAQVIQDRRMRQYRDVARTAWIDSGRHPNAFQVSWDKWLERGLPPQDYPKSLKAKQGRLV